MEDEIKTISKFKSYVVVIVTYLLALLTGFYMTILFKELHPVITIGLADLIATLVVFLFSFIFNNSSIYDPYWSIAPIPISLFYLLNIPDRIISTRSIIIILLICLWGIRLTYNWIKSWKGLSHEDWRYDNFRNSTGKAYWLVSLFGIMIFPTIIVYINSLSLYVSLSMSITNSLIIDISGLIVIISAIIIETLSDSQMRKYRKESVHSKTVIKGLWKYSRHPNYFGEILFWWGLYLFALSSNPSMWWAITGPILMTLMFIFISIPLIEKRMKKRRADYNYYIKTTSPLIPWFPLKKDKGIDD